MSSTSTTADAARLGVHGHVDPGFEAVRATFHDHLDGLGAGGGAFAAVLDGHLVVDLWGGSAAPGRPWTRDTTSVLMSATKALTVLVVQVLTSRGLIDPDRPVAAYWPEFAQAGKEEVTLRHVLTHTAGLLGLPHPGVVRWDGRGWGDQASIESALAAAPLAWPAGSRHGYHALTVGWLLDVVVRRVSGRSTGQYLDGEITAPGGIEAWLGTPSRHLNRVATVHQVAPLPPPLDERYAEVLQQARNPRTLVGQAFLGDGRSSVFDHLPDLMNNPTVLAVEIPAGNATATARGLASLLSVLVDGTLDGRRLLTSEALAAFDHIVSEQHDLVSDALNAPLADLLPPQPVPRTLGYLANGPAAGGVHRFGPSPGAYGAEGLGGQLTFCDPQHRLAVAFLRSELSLVSAVGPALVDSLYGCLT